MRIKTNEDYDMLMGACNGCGVAQSLARLFVELGNETSGTDEKNTHPEIRAYILKLADLAGLKTDAKDYAALTLHFNGGSK